jgi:hypothetical protein
MPGGSGTGLAQDATIQAIIAALGGAVPDGGSGTGLAQDASLQALYDLIAGGGSNPWVTTPASWSVTDWYVNPVTGSDANAGTSVGTAVRTIEGGVVAKWGTPTPVLAQTTTIHVLASETTGQESAVPSPILVGGSNFVIVGTLVAVGGSFSPSSVTSKNRSTPQLLNLHGMPAGAAQTQLVYNVTKASYATIDSIAGGVAVMTQPLTGACLTTVSSYPAWAEDDTWASTDTYQLYTQPTLNLKVVLPQGGDSNAALTTPVCWLQNLHIPDVSGVIGNSSFCIPSTCPAVVLSNCRIDPYYVQKSMPFVAGGIANCYLNGGAGLTEALVMGGTITGAGLDAGESTNIDGDAICHVGVTSHESYSIFGLVYTDAALDISHGVTAELAISPFFSACKLWGPGSVELVGGGILENATGNTWVTTILLTGSLEIEGVGSGWSPPCQGTFTLNGVTQVGVLGVNGVNAFPINAPISWALKTVGGTPGATAPYFSAAQTANEFFVKSGTANANDTYAWTAGAAPGVTISPTNLDIYISLTNPLTQSAFVGL